MNYTLYSQFQAMKTRQSLTDIESLKNLIKEHLKTNGISQKTIAQRAGATERNVSDWLGKNVTMDVFTLAKICEACNYNFFDHLYSQKQVEVVRDKKARVSVTIEVDNDFMERKVLETVLDKFTAKKLLG